MRTNDVIAAVVVSFSCALLTAACAQSSEPSSETDGADGITTVIETRADDEVYDVAVPLGVALELCVAAGKAGLDARRDFCNPAFVAPEQNRPCWAHLLLSRAEWIGWCYWNFE